MKYFKLCFLFLFVLLNIEAEGQWVLQTTIGTNERLTHLCVVDTLSAWGIGNINHDTSTVYMMDNGIWSKKPFYDFMYTAGISCIAATDLNTAWVGTENGRIYRTSDGGNKWDMVFDFGGSGYINDIKFSKTNKMVAYANCDPPAGYGTPFKILKTVDGGLNWTVYSPVFPNQYVGMSLSSSVTDSNHYWMGLNCQQYLCSVPRLAYTTNGGINWQVSALNHQADYLGPIEFASNNQLGFCSSNGVIGNTYIHKSINGGIGWYNHYVVNIEQGQGVTSINWIEGTTNWYFTTSSIANPPIYKSTNDGANWYPMEINNNTDQIEYACFFRKGNYVWGYASTLNGKIFQLVRDSANIVNVNMITSVIPDKYRLYQNYPNPFNPSTIIRFEIKDTRFTTLKIYNTLGKEVATLVNEKLQPGEYEYKFDARLYGQGTNLASGVYYYKLETDNFSETKKMLLIK
jgi:hypothetical protein